METIEQLANELNLVADKVDDLKTASGGILNPANRIDGDDQQAIQKDIKQLCQAQHTIHTIVASLNLIGEVILNERIRLEKKIRNPKRVVPS